MDRLKPHRRHPELIDNIGLSRNPKLSALARRYQIVFARMFTIEQHPFPRSCKKLKY